MIKNVKQYISDYLDFIETNGSNFNAWKVLNINEEEYISNFIEKRFNKKFSDSKNNVYLSYSLETLNTIKVFYKNKSGSKYHFLIELN